MKSINSRVTRSLPTGAMVNVVDNSGARIIKVISVKGHKTRKRRYSAAGVADLITASVIAGKPDMRHKLVQALIVRQKKEYRRPNGIKVKFEDNAAVVMKDVRLGLPKGTMVKGPIAKEVAIRWSQIAKISSTIL